MSRLKLFAVLLLSLACTLGAVAQVGTAPQCPLSAIVTDDTSSGKSQIIALPSGLATPPIYINGVATVNPNKPTIHICSIKARIIQASGAANYGLVYGTGSNCATGATNITPQWLGTASVTEDWTQYYGKDAAPAAAAGTAVCWSLSAAPTHSQLLVTYGIW